MSGPPAEVARTVSPGQEVPAQGHGAPVPMRWPLARVAGGVAVCAAAWAGLVALASPEVTGWISLQAATAVVVLAWLDAPDRRRRRALAIPGAVLGALLVLEGGALVLEFLEARGSGGPQYAGARARFWEIGGPLGYRVTPSSRVVARWSIHGEVVRNATYTFDADGRRRTAGDPAGACGFVFHGGGRTFGEGLDDVETLPYFFSRELGFGARVVNAALPVFGPQQLLRALELAAGARGDAPGWDGVFYVLSSDDVQRVAGDHRSSRYGPAYVLDARGAVRHLGASNRPWPLVAAPAAARRAALGWLRNSAAFRVLYGFPEAHARPAREASAALLVAVLSRAGHLLRTAGRGPLVVVTPANADAAIHGLARRLRAAGLSVVEDVARGRTRPGLPAEAGGNEAMARRLAAEYGGCKK